MKNSFSLAVDIEGMTIDKLAHRFNHVEPRIIRTVQQQTINEIVTKVKRRAMRNTAKAAKIKPQKLVKPRFKQFKANKFRLVGGVYGTYSSIPLNKMGKVLHKRSWVGARVKGKYYPHSFAGTPSKGKGSGKKQIYYKKTNTGDPRYDLEIVKKDISQYHQILGKVGTRYAKANMEKIFVNRLEFKLSRIR